MQRATGLLLVAIAAAVASAAGEAAAPAPKIGPLCKSLAKGLGIDESVLGGFLPLLPSPSSSNFCGDYGCTTISLLEFALLKDSSGLVCDNDSQDVPPGELTPLRDERPLPAQFNDSMAVFDSEGETYNWLYVQARNARMFAPCVGNASAPDARLVMPEGWALVDIANITQPQGAVPFMFVIQNTATNQVAFIFRGTLTSYEWGTLFQYNQTSAPDVLEQFGAPMEFGFMSVFKEVWPTTKKALDDLVVNGPPGTEVYMAGHSLGGAQAGLAAYAGQKYLNQQMGAEAPIISEVGIAPLNQGQAGFAQSFNELVNGRRVFYENDISSQLPCAPSMLSCPEKPEGILSTFGVTAIPTDQNNVTSWPYEATGGALTFSSMEMPQDADTWSLIDKVPLCYAFSYLDAAHTCSYYCFLSSFSSSSTKNSCWLSKKPGDVAGSQCAKFPVEGYLDDDAASAPATAPASAPSTPASKTAPAPAGSTTALSTSAAPRLAAAPLPTLLLVLLAAVLLA